MPIGKYKGISIPKEMFEEVEKVIKEHPELGYSSITDFIKDAVRDKITEIRKIHAKSAEEIAEEFENWSEDEKKKRLVKETDIGEEDIF
jgi:metal-responsive CopG/Arc/MetJ family transcriptional regulator